MIPYGKQHIDQDDIDAVTDVLQADFLTQGPIVAKFEREFAMYTHSQYGVSVSNGTAALHLAVKALGIKPNQKVITTPITFAASANCILFNGGQVEFVDIDPKTGLMDLNLVDEKLKSSKPGEYAGVIPVDFAGLVIDTEKLKKITDKYNLWIIEDACHAPGGFFIDSNKEKVYAGSCKYVDACIFSFHPVKHIACGEGGMITTNDPKLVEKLNLLRTHGISKSANHLSKNDGGWYYEMIELGYNYRMTDIQCALGISQLKKQVNWIKARRKIAQRYQDAFEIHGVKTLLNLEGHAYHLFVILVEQRKELYDTLRNSKIYTQVHYIPIHTMPYYAQFGYKQGDFPLAEEYYSKCLSLPMYPTLTIEQQDFVIEKTIDFV